MQHTSATKWIILLAATALGAATTQPATLIEISKPKPPAGFVGTVQDKPSESERPFREKVTEDTPMYWALDIPPAEGEKPDPKQIEEDKKTQAEQLAKAKAYTLAAQAGQYVGWFGIVREKSSDPVARRSELLIQHCYYDGMTDPDLQVVSIFGTGDFRALIDGGAENIPSLSLVRIYGKVSAARDGTAQVTAEYVRVWDWGLFTFMDYGFDKTSKQWTALRHIKDDDVYTSHPTTRYYEEILGKRESSNKS